MFKLSALAWLRVGAVAALAAVFAWTHLQAYQRGRASVVERLQSDRITILKDGKKIDENALNADNAGLCALLGGCELPDSRAD